MVDKLEKDVLALDLLNQVTVIEYKTKRSLFRNGDTNSQLRFPENEFSEEEMSAIAEYLERALYQEMAYLYVNDEIETLRKNMPDFHTSGFADLTPEFVKSTGQVPQYMIDEYNRYPISVSELMESCRANSDEEKDEPDSRPAGYKPRARLVDSPFLNPYWHMEAPCLAIGTSVFNRTNKYLLPALHTVLGENAKKLQVEEKPQSPGPSLTKDS